jgi:uncharacterized metal-binding protein YceD (DUF177 family)
VTTSHPEFSRPVRIDALPATGRELSVEANEEERAALAKRFGLVAIDRLSADVALKHSGDEVRAEGRLVAAVVQSCVATQMPVPAELDEPFSIVFRPHPQGVREEEEIELSEGELDVIFYDGSGVDLGEAVAETLSLSLDPYPRSPEAHEALRKAGVKSEEEERAESSPFAALAALKDKLKS